MLDARSSALARLSTSSDCIASRWFAKQLLSLQGTSFSIGRGTTMILASYKLWTANVRGANGIEVLYTKSESRRAELKDKGIDTK